MTCNFSINYFSKALILSAILIYSPSLAQQSRTITLQEAVTLGLQNSKFLKLSQAKVDRAIAQYKQAKDASLPSGSVTYAYSHAELPTHALQLPGQSDRLHIPDRFDNYIGTLSLQEVVFGGNRMRYAKESTDLLAKAARLDAEKDSEEIIYSVTSAYFNLYKLQQSQKIVEQNLESVNQQLKQAQRFFEQGIVTKNDVLRFQLQQSTIQLSKIDIEANRKIVSYNLDILLGLPEEMNLEVASVNKLTEPAVVNAIDSALANRKDLKAIALQGKVAETHIKSIKAEKLPSFLIGVNAYYINPNGKFIPPSNTFLTPVTVGATLAWNFDRLWMNKNKLTEAKIQKTQVDINRELTIEYIKTEVNQNYQNYLKAIDKIRILETTIAPAQENDRIMESKYRNNIASVTDRIDAQTQLYQSLINLELAKADAGIAYYTLLKSTGTLTRQNTL